MGMNPFVAGFGATKHQGATSNVLRDAQVPIVSRQSCEQSYKSVFQFVQFSDKVSRLEKPTLAGRRLNTLAEKLITGLQICEEICRARECRVKIFSKSFSYKSWTCDLGGPSG